VEKLEMRKIMEENTTIAILGQKGCGKTVAAAMLANELKEKDVILIDTVGAWAKDKLVHNAVYVQAGLTTYKQMAATLDKCFKERRRVVVNIANMIQAEKVYVVDLLSQYCLKRGNIAVIADEAAFFCPQGKENYSYEFDRLVMAGRNYGVRPVVFITQRPQRLNKDILALADYYIVFRLLHNLDRGKVQDLIGMKKEEWLQFESKIMSLKVKECYLFNDDLEFVKAIMPEYRKERKKAEGEEK
jgi:DNA helicase HerA-like ATPase